MMVVMQCCEHFFFLNCAMKVMHSSTEIQMNFAICWKSLDFEESKSQITASNLIWIKFSGHTFVVALKCILSEITPRIMKKFVLSAVLVVCALPVAWAQYNPSNLSLKTEMAVEQFSFEKLRIYPITANRVFIEAHKSFGNYKPLKSGLEDGSVKIIEQGAAATIHNPTPSELGIIPSTVPTQTDPAMQPNANHVDADAHVIRYEHQQQMQQGSRSQIRATSNNENSPLEEQQVVQQLRINNSTAFQNIAQLDGGGASDAVNNLYIQNNGQDSVFIMAGEVVKGGKQDRVIAMDMVIPPHSEPIDLSVFCVEHGRWTYGGGSDAMADGFTSQAAVANTSVRKAAIVEKDQSQVWSKVAEVTTANKAQTSTGTLNALENSADYQKELQAYLNKFGELPSSATSVIGVVAVTGDRVIGCDMFATPDLFRNAFPDLLKSYASEAITSGAKVSISNAAVDKYIANILDESKQKERVLQNGQMYEQGGKKMHISTF